MYGTTLYAPSVPRGLGDALDDLGLDTSGAYDQDPAIARLHQLTLLILQLRSEVNDQLDCASNADCTTFDANILSGLIQSLAQQQANFRTMRSQIDATTVQQNALTGLDGAMLAVQSWAQQTLAAIPGAIAALPNAVADGLTKIATNTGTDLAQSIAVPALLIGGLLLAGIAIVKQAERTRTGRALARRV